ncbi:AraC family transcriptional regulator [Pseudomonas fluorescens]|uniref:AraC family transcriptional regulator n=1 Tax=Pseudomonas fluorescens TaxID=294 RepID=A0A1T2YCP2_PSEFL|nr:AraC family transcriptional regulator [Pseudomonas fluorescens]OPA89834.1 AraC family transcriptional regulator [Pseudomonas fluorescens]
MNNALNELRHLVMRAANTWTDTGLPRVAMVCAEACADQVYQPMLHLVLQGSKTLSIGDQVATYDPSSYFVVPVEVPATGQVHPNAPGLPYLAVSLTLDPSVIAAVLADEIQATERRRTQGFAAVQAPSEMLDAWLRMLRLMDRPNEVAVLAPMIEREILFRVLQGPLRETLVDMARPDGRLVQIRRATEWIRQHYTEPFRVEPLAAMTDMSVAAFYRHFKAVTAMTPIQYQKRLRLLRARWLLLFDTLDAAAIAFTVGYESASQFSREYARLFGLPPGKDAARFKAPAAGNTSASAASNR